MFALLLLTSLTAATPDASSPAADRCRARLAARLGELGTYAPGQVSRHGRRTTISGVVDALEKPPPAPPGMMAPTHILVARYRFRCELRAGVVRSVAVHRAAD